MVESRPGTLDADTCAATEKEPLPPGFQVAADEWNGAIAGRRMTLDDWHRLTFDERARYNLRAPLLTFTVSIARNGDVTNDTQSYGSTFSEVYRAFQAIKAEVQRQIDERRACPFNPKYGEGIAPEEASPRQVVQPIRDELESVNGRLA